MWIINSIFGVIIDAALFPFRGMSPMGSGRISTSRIHHTAQIQRALLEDEGLRLTESGRVDLDLYGWSPEPGHIDRILRETDA